LNRESAAFYRPAHKDQTAIQMTEDLTLFFNCTTLIVHPNNDVNFYVKDNEIS
jgi:hypothetical protein